MNIFKAYDIRGVYKKDFDEKEAYLIGYYLVRLLNLENIKVAHDSRISQEILTKFFIKGILDAGSRIIYLGKVSTPNFYFSLFKGVNNGVMITASHNPKEYNGFKFMINGESFDSRNGLYDLKKLVEEDRENKKNNFNKFEKELIIQSLDNFLLKNNIELNSPILDYVNFLKEKFSFLFSKKDLIHLKNIKFAVDFSSGVSSIAVKKLLTELDLNVIFYNDIPDGNFPNHSPDPLKAIDYLKGKEDGTEFSCAFDGDGDRIVFFDKNKNLILTDLIIISLIDYFNKKEDLKNFVVDLRISKSLKKLEEEKKLNIILSRVGRAFYKNIMDKEKCRFGAELSGHLFFSDFNGLDNPDLALIYMLRIILDIKNQDKNQIQIQDIQNLNFNKIFDKYNLYSKLSELNLKVDNPDEIILKLKNKFKNNIESELDGISFKFDDWWFNIRKSNTEPIVRINLEAKTKEIAENKLDELKKIM